MPEKAIVNRCNRITQKCLCSFTAYYYANITDSLASVPIASVVPDMAGSYFTISDFPVGLINITGQYNGTSGIATSPVVSSSVQLVVNAPAPQPAVLVSLSGGDPLTFGRIQAFPKLHSACSGEHATAEEKSWSADCGCAVLSGAADFCIDWMRC